MSEGKEEIGFIGLGNMGQPMARNLRKAGYSLHVYNRNASKAEPLVAQGARLAQQPSQVIEPGEPGGIVVTMVANDDALESIVRSDGFLERLGNGIHLSMSTIGPATARRLAELHAQRGSAYVAAPVFGRPEAAAAQKLWICVSGPKEAKKRVYPVLEAMSQGVFDLGEEASMANVVKICGNFMIASALETMAEALALAEKNGIDRKAVIDLFGQTMFSCPIYQNYGKIIAERRFTPVGFLQTLGLKDINLLLDTAEQAHMSMPVASLLHDRLITGVAKGRGDMDWTTLTITVDEDAGLSQGS